MRLKKFQVYITTKDDKNPSETKEVVICATPTTLRELGLFFVNSAHEMEINDADHIHLQDRLAKFSNKKHCEIVLVNKKLTKQQ